MAICHLDSIDDRVVCEFFSIIKSQGVKFRAMRKKPNHGDQDRSRGSTDDGIHFLVT